MTDLLSPDAVTSVVSDGVHLFWTTPFEEYTVTEGLLLLLLIVGFIALVVWFFKGGF